MWLPRRFPAGKPARASRRATGFEDQEGHQAPFVSEAEISNRLRLDSRRLSVVV